MQLISEYGGESTAALFEKIDADANAIVSLEEFLGFMQGQIKEEGKEWAKGFLDAIVVALAEKGSPVAAIVEKAHTAPTHHHPLTLLATGRNAALDSSPLRMRSSRSSIWLRRRTMTRIRCQKRNSSRYISSKFTLTLLRPLSRLPQIVLLCGRPTKATTVSLSSSMPTLTAT